MKKIMSSKEMRQLAVDLGTIAGRLERGGYRNTVAQLRKVANRLDQAGDAKLARKVTRTKATIRRNAR